MKVTDELYNILNPLSLALYVRISIAVYGKYRAALRHIACAFGANIDLHIVPSSTVAATTVPLLHKARQSRAGEGWQFSTYHLRRLRKYRAHEVEHIHLKSTFARALRTNIDCPRAGEYRAALRHITCAFGANIERAERAYPRGTEREVFELFFRSFFALFFITSL